MDSINHTGNVQFFFCNPVRSKWVKDRAGVYGEILDVLTITYLTDHGSTTQYIYGCTRLI